MVETGPESKHGRTPYTTFRDPPLKGVRFLVEVGVLLGTPKWEPLGTTRPDLLYLSSCPDQWVYPTLEELSTGDCRVP